MVIILVDQLFWRPLVAWGDRFKLERSAAAETPHSWYWLSFAVHVWPVSSAGNLGPLRETFSNCVHFPSSRAAPRYGTGPRHDDRLYHALLVLLAIGLEVWGMHFILTEVGLGEVGQVLLMGLATFARVVLLVVLSTVIWVPIGVAIGFTPRLAQLLSQWSSSWPRSPRNFSSRLRRWVFIKAGSV